MEFVRHLLMAIIAVMKRVVLAGFGVWSRGVGLGFPVVVARCWFVFCSVVFPVRRGRGRERRGCDGGGGYGVFRVVGRGGSTRNMREGESGVMREAAGSGCSPATVAVGENNDEEKEGVAAAVGRLVRGRGNEECLCGFPAGGGVVRVRGRRRRRG
ncbi:hypothetical protein HAX54_021912 [Datura stramonium]|uniref:Uncharacterized protein n=1 Tax=Datura stramonium TaxID=4076 RepID=A0ABS8UTL2_DATST|nr:hypothetical protein [Datura stramonium]